MARPLVAHARGVPRPTLRARMVEKGEMGFPWVAVSSCCSTAMVSYKAWTCILSAGARGEGGGGVHRIGWAAAAAGPKVEAEERWGAKVAARAAKTSSCCKAAAHAVAKYLLGIGARGQGPKSKRVAC